MNLNVQSTAWSASELYVMRGEHLWQVRFDMCVENVYSHVHGSHYLRGTTNHMFKPMPKHMP